jgi:hypothetical protein
MVCFALRGFLKEGSMKTWFVLAGTIGVGLVALFGGPKWFSQNVQPNPADGLEALTEEAAIEDVVPPGQAHEKPAAIRLELRLPENQALPLLKSVEQVLVQKTEDGERVSHSSLELAVTMRLEEVAEDGSQLLSVVYNRVRYRQDVAGKTFVFDSSVPSGQLPVEALPYKGLVGNGFSFWIGKDHRIIKPVGFADFLKRCIREVPLSQQQNVLTAFADAADEGVANFVDDSIGFLPPGSILREGEFWTHERRLAKPIPLHLETQCTLKRVTDAFAEIDIDGTIGTTKTFAPETSPQGDLQVIVRGGRSKGHSEIDRKTGLPLYSEIKRYVDMDVQLADGQKFAQQKITTTIIRLFPQQSAEPPRSVIQVGAEQPQTD